MISDSRLLSRALLLGWFASAAALAPVCNAQISTNYTIATFAGNGTSGYSGDGGSAPSAEIGGPFSVAVDGSGNVYITDQFSNRIRVVSSSGTISTYAGNGTQGYKGDGGSPTAAELFNPTGVTVDASGNVYIADTGNNVIREVTGGNINTITGNNTAGAGYAGDGGPAKGAQIYFPVGMAFDSGGNFYFTDTGNDVVRMITKSSGNISTVAGYGGDGYTGDGGKATTAALSAPYGVTVDSHGNIYIADTRNNVIRLVNPQGIISTFAGTGVPGFSGDGGPAIKAQLYEPRGIASDADGNIYVADSLNNRVRVITPDGFINTIAGNGSPGFGGDGGPATLASMFFPTGLAIGPGGTIYVADDQNSRIRVLKPGSQIPAISANGIISASGFGAFPSISPGTFIEIYGSNLAPDTRSWGPSDFTGNNAPLSLDGTSVTVGGQSAFVEFISPGQVNVLVPLTVPTGSQPVVLTTVNGISEAYTATIAAAEPGLLALPTFKTGGNQYVTALFTDFTTYVAPTNAISGYTTKPAQAGDIIVFFGVGFGEVTPATPAGQLSQGPTALVNQVQFLFGNTPGTVMYAGLAPGDTGLYQFNVQVPSVPANSLLPLTFSQNGATGTQTLFIAVQ